MARCLGKIGHPLTGSNVCSVSVYIANLNSQRLCIQLGISFTTFISAISSAAACSEVLCSLLVTFSVATVLLTFPQTVLR